MAPMSVYSVSVKRQYLSQPYCLALVVYIKLYVSPVKLLSSLVIWISGHFSCYFCRQMASPLFLCLPTVPPHFSLHLELVV